MQFANYQTEGFHDEMFDATGAPRDESPPSGRYHRLAR